MEVRAPDGGHILEIDWSDGSTTRHRHRDLRAFCPCAGCQGHQGPIRHTDVPETPDALLLDSLEEVGNYGLQLAWRDGHRTGIYAFPYFLEMASLFSADEAERASAIFGR